MPLNLIDQYCEKHTTPPSSLLDELLRETHLKTLAPQMASGYLQGTLLRFLSRMIRPATVLEIGSFTGYATLCLLEGLLPQGKIHTIEVNQELAYIIEKYIDRAGAANRIQLHIGDAKKIIPTINATYDLVFIDAGKMHYPQYYDLIIDRVNPGGYILADNVLWDGKVVRVEKDRDTEILDYFNKKIHQDPRVENILLPIRDGLMLARKLD